MQVKKIYNRGNDLADIFENPDPKIWTKSQWVSLVIFSVILIGCVLSLIYHCMPVESSRKNAMLGENLFDEYCCEYGPSFLTDSDEQLTEGKSQSNNRTKKFPSSENDSALSIEIPRGLKEDQTKKSNNCVNVEPLINTYAKFLRTDSTISKKSKEDILKIINSVDNKNLEVESKSTTTSRENIYWRNYPKENQLEKLQRKSLESIQLLKSPSIRPKVNGLDEELKPTSFSMNHPASPQPYMSRVVRELVMKGYGVEMNGDVAVVKRSRNFNEEEQTLGMLNPLEKTNECLQFFAGKQRQHNNTPPAVLSSECHETSTYSCVKGKQKGKSISLQLPENRQIERKRTRGFPHNDLIKKPSELLLLESRDPCTSQNKGYRGHGNSVLERRESHKNSCSGNKSPYNYFPQNQSVRSAQKRREYSLGNKLNKRMASSSEGKKKISMSNSFQMNLLESQIDRSPSLPMEPPPPQSPPLHLSKQRSPRRKIVSD
mmetsp:Transcript_6833/g.14742  ORF Transcript_6833/g.14742 Transcript_6833/m.14742 type:complete len:488 (-) Transcript_6833:621-2084(-)